VDEGFIDVKQAVVANHQVPEIAQSSIGSLDLPTLAVASEWSSILIRFAHSVCLVGHDQLNASLL
jgi:hypothetical protein